PDRGVGAPGAGRHPDAGGAELRGDALRALRVASVGAAVWTVAAVAVHLLTLSDLVGLPLAQALSGRAVPAYTADIPQGQAYGIVVVLAASLAVSSRLVLRHGGAVALLVLAVSALVPPTLVGHSSTGDYHHSATVSLLVHVVGVVLWAGGLVAVSWYAAVRGRWLSRAAASYSRLALACFVAVGASGVLNAGLRLRSPLDLVTTAYGGLLSVKVLALVVLGVLGVRHRRSTLPDLEAGRPGAFRRLAAGEVVLLAATTGLAVALSRTAPPVPEDPGQLSVARSLLGFPVPPEVSPLRLLTEVYPDAFFALGLCFAALVYAAGLVQLRRRGVPWHVGRTISWYAGLGVVALATLSGLGTYGMLMLSVHMSAHMALARVAPVLLVLGAPVTLALRAIRPAARGERGPREVVLAATRSRAVRVLTHPMIAFPIFGTAVFMVYFTPLFEYAMRHHTAHILMSLHFLGAGYLFYEVIIGVDPLPRRPPWVARIVLQFAAMALHAFFGVALMASATLVAGRYYAQLAADVPWLPDTLADQERAGEITWGFGELPALLVLGALLVQWWRSDERDARRLDRRGDADLEAYNRYLAELSRGGRGRTAGR
ncbi:MAG: cytochrome c oxidase assembly protein, partial [Pseudonocardia sp.]